EMTLREARALHFERSGFGADGGYGERWIKVKVWRVPVWLPNTEGRRKAVRLHDLHHVLTEYPTTWRGEAEISSWEIASGGLRRFWAGWVLDLLSVAQGLVVNPRGAFRAFLRGRRSRNLFGETFSDELLTRRVGEMRREMLLDDEGAGARLKATTDEVLAFAAWSLAGAATYLVAVGLPLAAVFVPVFALLRLARVL
ncbi:MAG: hypothetical protein LC746_18975, partial [Acidobacteria bacterium]|nr:hypothetical protein [Acidobacteriota bacterium]